MTQTFVTDSSILGDSQASTDSVSQRVAFRLITTAAIGCALFVHGCSSGPGDIPDSKEISGTVTYNGKPLTSGSVRYTPATQGEGLAATGMIGPDGTFEMETSASVPGVAYGEYQITIQPGGGPTGETPMDSASPGPPAGHPGADPSQAEAAFPQKYTLVATSGLTDTVDENHSGTKTIELSD